jgi:hypothetical protein
VLMAASVIKPIMVVQLSFHGNKHSLLEADLINSETAPGLERRNAGSTSQRRGQLFGTDLDQRFKVV